MMESERSFVVAMTTIFTRSPSFTSRAAAHFISTDTSRTPRFITQSYAANPGLLTSLDGGGLRSNTHELLGFIDVAIVAERLCEQMGHEPAAMLDYLKSRGCRIGGVTLGERGMIWYDEAGVVRDAPCSCRTVE